MKKIVIIILVIVIAITSIVFAKYVEYSKQKNEVEIINKEYLAYRNSDIQINTIVSLMGKAIEQNKKNNIKQDENKIFAENDTNSIKIYMEVESSDQTRIVRIPMEELILGEKAGTEKVELSFSTSIFRITDVQYHKKTGQVKQIVFTEKTIK